jgi:HK97 family phage major capsid protein
MHETPATLLGKPWYENSNMDGVINAAATESNFVAVYGDIAKAMTVVDRVGASVEFIDNLVGANGRPTGQRGAILWLMTGSRVQVPNAARLLDVPTTA